MHTVGQGWVVLTKIGPREDPIGWFSNDTAISGAPLDEVQQESLAVYCSLLGNIIVRKRAAQEREILINALEAKNAELERFTYTVSHDLKSPLITIRGFLGFLQKDAEAGNFDRLRADVARISEATDKMQRLLNELLELSRIGRIVNPPQEVSMTQLVQEALALVEGRIAARGARVEVMADLPPVLVDRVRIVEALQNLFDNAMKFMGDQPEPRLEIGVRADTDPPVFFVKDNGIGIHPRYHERVFGLFDKLDAKSEGTGVGLALVKRIIQVHGGRVWVESAGPGHGTTFCFTLPVAKAQA
jgi:signal transduction histidine kinase